MAPTPEPTVSPLATKYIQDLMAQKLAVRPEKTESFELPNKMKVVVVSQPLAKQSAISVRVDAGSYQDPRQYRGLAHFLEHVLFLGSQKYPVADEFMSFINARQGETNAFTREYETNYQASIRPQDFAEVVDRLSDFFVAPLFDAAYIDKELNAIQSEYDKNIENMFWRLIHISRTIYADSHPHRWSFQGNRQTLGNIPREVMLDFFNKYYSANNMTLVMVGPQTTDELKALAQNTFAKVPNRNVPTPKVPDLVISRVKPASLFEIKIQQKEYVLYFGYDLPPVSGNYWQTKPLELLSQIAGDEGPGSLVKYLKQKGWVNTLSAEASTSTPSSSGFGFLITLTPEGYKHWQEIASGLIAYIEALKNTGFNENAFRNTQRTAELSYLYTTAEPMEFAVGLAGLLRAHPASEAMARSILFPLADQGSYVSTLNSLDIKNLDIFVAAPDIEGGQKSEFYDAQFKTTELSRIDWVKQPKPFADFQFPVVQLNPYMPQNLQLVSDQDKAPIVVSKSDLSTVSLVRDSEFKVPMGNILTKIVGGPEFKYGAEDSVLNNMLQSYLSEALNDWSYVPGQAGYSFAYSPLQNGVLLTFNGFSDRLPFFAQEVLVLFKNLQINAELLERVKDNNIRKAQNRDVEDAYQQVLWVRDLLGNPHSYSDRNLMTLIKGVTAAKLQDFHKRLLASGKLEILGMGNLTPAAIKEAAQTIETKLGLKASAEVKPVVTASAPAGASVYRMSRTGANNAWFSEYQLGPSTVENQATAQLAAAYFGPAFFAHMRTEKQYGYVAFASSTRERRQTSLIFLVQSQTAAPEVAHEGRRWLKEDFLQGLKDMPKAQFEAVRSSLVTNLLLAPSTKDEKLAPFRLAFMNASYPSKADIAAAVANLTQEQLVQRLEPVLFGKERREAVIYLESTQTPNKAPLNEGETLVDSLEDYWSKTRNW